MGPEIEIHGHYDPRFEPVASRLRKQIRRYGGGGAAALFVEGHLVVDIWGGQARRDGTRWKRDSMSVCYSGTKGVVSTALHVLASDGLVDFDAPVAEYWPEFGCRGKERVTVRQLLSHQAGLHRIGPVIEKLTDILDWELMVSRLQETEPDFSPGTANAYQALSFGWLVGEVLRRVSGLEVPALVQRRIAEPLGLDGLHVGEADTQMDRICDVVGLPELSRRDAPPLLLDEEAPWWTPSARLRNLYQRGLTPQSLKRMWSHPDFWKACLPAINGVATARSLAKMYAALATGGALDGVRLVSPDVVRRASEVQTRRADRVVIYPLHWRLGYHRADALVLNVPEAFGHFGLGGTGGWANPALQAGFAFVHNGSPITVVGQTRTVTMTAAVYESLGIYKGAWHTLRRGPMVDIRPRRA